MGNYMNNYVSRRGFFFSESPNRFMKECFIVDSKDEYFFYQMYLFLRCLQLLYLEVKFQVIPTVFNYEEKKIGALKHTNLMPCANYRSIKMRI